MKSLDYLKEKISQIYFLIIFSVLTLYIHDGYFDILRTKNNILIWSAFFYVIAISCIVIIEVGFDKIQIKDFFEDFNTFDYCLLAFAAISALSTGLSKTPSFAFWGSDSCRIGSFTLILLCLSCILLSKYIEINKPMIAVMIICGMIVYIGCIIDCFDLDPLGWHENIAASHYDYLSTIGIRDNLDGFLALSLSFVVVLFVFENDIRLCIVYGIYLLFGFISLYIAKNDGNLLVFGSGIFLVYYMIREKADIRRAVYLLIILIVSSLATEIICLFVEPVNVVGHSIMGMLLEYKWYIGLVVLSFILWMLRDKKAKPSYEKAWVVFSLVVIAVLFIVVIINFDYTFASNRAYIWSYGLETFMKSPPRTKLIGWGPDCYEYAIYSTVEERIMSSWPEPNHVANGHNEAIQYLVTTGLLGMIAYLSMYILSLSTKLKEKNILGIAAKAAIFAYFCQALGTNPSSVNYGILFIMFAIVNRKKKGLSRDW